MRKKDINSLYGKVVTINYYYKDTDSIKLRKPSLFRRIKRRIKECPHFCCFCKYKSICDISWWKRRWKNT